MTINQEISRQILVNINNGLNVSEAFDAVLGAGSYKKLAGEIHDQLQGG